MKNKLTSLLIILSSLLLLNSCSKNEIDENNNNNNNNNQVQMTPTEQALVGKWKWVKTESYNIDGSLSSISKNGGIRELYFNGIFNYSIVDPYNDYYNFDFLDEFGYYEPVQDVNYYKSYKNDNGLATESFWHVRRNYGGSGKEYLFAPQRYNGGYIYSLTPNSYILRSTIDPNKKNTEIHYWERM
jgi:hypothetical protein